MMSDNADEKPIRRVGKDTRKKQLPRAGALFPDDEVPSQPLPDFDIDNLPLPDTDADALAMLANLKDEVRAPIISPQEERYPPLRPSSQPPLPPQSVTTKQFKAPPRSNLKYNLITFFAVLGTLFTGIWLALVWVNPQTPFNPLSPPTPYAIVTATPFGMPTADAEGQIFIVITDTPSAPLNEPAIPTYPYVLQNDIQYQANDNEFACNWWSIAGTTLGIDGEPVNGLRVRIIGAGLDEAIFTGTSRSFGDGGFELPLIGTPREESFTVQLFSVQDAPLSEPVTFQTRGDCEGNVTILTFTQIR